MAVQKIAYAIPCKLGMSCALQAREPSMVDEGMCSIAGHYLRLSINLQLFAGQHMRGLVSF